MSLTFGSLFAGIAGFDLGFHRNGHRCLWQVEIDEAARGVLARHWPDVQRFDDITKVRTDDLAAVDVVCGGFPCQDLSVAGRRAGLAGERSGLFYEFMRVVADRRPAWVVIENVPGLLSSNEGRDMGTVVGTLGQLGYGWAYRVLDAQHFGVAQRRRRVFIVGCLGDAARAAAVLFEPASCEWDSAPRREAGQRVTGPIADSSGNRGWSSSVDVQMWVEVPSVASTLGSRGTRSHTELDGHGAYIPAVAGSVTTRYGKGVNTTLDDGAVVAFTQNQRDEVRDLGDLAGALTPAMAVRRLTPTECERLQGFPDGWTAGQSDSARYRQLGNAVCVNVSEWIGRRIIAAT